MPVLQQQGGFLLDGAAALSRRAHDLLLQVHQLQAEMEGVMPPPHTTFIYLWFIS